MPYDYPAPKPPRKHAPAGYSDYADYRPWLRDEFAFRCAYCLHREQWAHPANIHLYFQLDHIYPKSKYPEKSKDYQNLAYTCMTCNWSKRAKVPNVPPLESLTKGRVWVEMDGLLVFDRSDIEIGILIESLELNRPGLKSYRAQKFKEFDNRGDGFRALFGFPEDLPDLANVKKPGSNARPEGVQGCYFERKKAGTLPGEYC